MVKEILERKGIKIALEYGYFGIIELEVNDICGLEKNANKLIGEKFKLLSENIKHDGALSSIPFVVYEKETDRFIVISGNHRIKALKQNKIEKTPCIIPLKELSKDEILRIQLSHNSIKGTDDKQILQELMDSFESTDLQSLSGVNSQYLEELESFTDIKLESLDDLPPQECVVLVSPFVLEDMKEKLKEILGKEQTILIIGEKTFDDFKENLRTILDEQEMGHIISLNLIFPVIMEIINNWCNSKKEIAEVEVDNKIFVRIGKYFGNISTSAYEVFKKNIKNINNLDEILLNEGFKNGKA